MVLPSRDDSLVRSGSEGIGGVAGDRVRPAPRRVMAVLLVLTGLACALALLQKAPCRSDGWTDGGMYPQLCYSDIALLYSARGLADGLPLYEPSAGHDALEYPVLTGMVMAASARVTNLLNGDAAPVDRGRTFFDVTVLVLTACALATTWLIARTAGRRPWDAAMFALAPGLVLTAWINWDLLAVALTAGFLFAWSRRSPVLAGLLLGLAVAAKFYPVVLLGPLFLLCLRAGRLGAFARTAGVAAFSFAVVNAPVFLAHPDGWSRFYAFSQERGAGFGSLWYALGRSGHGLPDAWLNRVSSGLFLLACVGIAVLALAAKRRPRLGQLAFLVVAAFTLANKVYSPQYVLWLLALFPLARPRWREFLLWQAAEVVYFVAVWWHLEGLTNSAEITVPEWTHTGATLLRMGVTAWVVGLVVRDALRPEHDPVRADGSDDPAGGVLDGAPDVVVLPWARPGQGAVPQHAR